MKPVVPPILSEEDARGMRIEITPTENGNPGHGFGRRSVYINGIGVAALKDDTLQTFPIDTLIIKEINNNTNTFVQHVATMKKTDDPVYAAHNGWLYTQHTRQTETAKFVAVGGDVPGSTSEGCHACHAQAPKDSVFTQLPTPDPAVEDVPTPSEPEAEPEPTQEQPQETQTPEETDDAPSEVEPRPPFVPNL